LYALNLSKGNDDNSNGVPGVYIGIIVGVSAIVILILITMVVYLLYAFKRGRM